LRLAAWPDDRPVWTGSCPCQPFSTAGTRKGFADERHLWPAWFSLIRELCPPIVFGEQVEAAIGWGWIDAVFSDLEQEGYACGTAVLPACGVGAPHIRQRLWFVADAVPTGWPEGRPSAGNGSIAGRSIVGELAAALADPTVPRRDVQQERIRSPWAEAEWIACRDDKSRPVEPGTFPLAHGIPARVGRLRAYGNAIVPQIAAEFIKATGEFINERQSESLPVREPPAAPDGE
jgi:DNA (cytosine-5)-methyltransferase 1